MTPTAASGSWQMESADQELMGDRAAVSERGPCRGLPEANQPFDSFGEGRSVSGEILEKILRLRPLNTVPDLRGPRP
jgi:hypothetical protein